MAVAQAYGKTITSGSVFAYDVADTRNSYIGEPTVNKAGGVHLGFSGDRWAKRTDYPQKGALPFKLLGDVYQLTNGNNYWGSAGDFSPTYNKTYTLSYWYYLSTDSNLSQWHNSFFGAPQAGGSEYTTVSTKSNDTFSVTGTNTWRYGSVNITTSTPVNSYTYFRGTYTSGGGDNMPTGQIYIANFQLEEKSHATPFTTGTRSATQGLLPLVGNTSLDLSTVSFDSNAQMTFDGTNDGIIISDSQYNKTNGQPLTVEVVMKPGRNTGQYQDIVVNRSDGLYNWMLYQHADDGSIQMHGAAQNKSGYIPTIGQYIHVVATITSGQVSTLYINGQVQQVVTGFTYAGMSPSLLCIGVFGTGRYEPYLGTIDVVKIYNRALSEAEVKQNFDFYDARFGIEYDTYYFTVSNRADRYVRRYTNEYYETIRLVGKNMASTTPAYILYQKPDASNTGPGDYVELTSDPIGSPVRLTEYGNQTSYSNGRYFTDVIVYKGKRGGPLRFEFPNGGTSQYGENFYKTIITPYVS